MAIIRFQQSMHFPLRTISVYLYRPKRLASKFKEHFNSIMQIYAIFVYLKRAVCPPLPARHGGAGVSAKADGGGEPSSGVVICLCFYTHFRHSFGR
jgi:hypothetical protein